MTKCVVLEVRHLAEVLLDYMTFVALVFAIRLSFALGFIEMRRSVGILECWISLLSSWFLNVEVME